MAVASESYAPSVLVSTEGLPEKDWLEYRRRGIGGSDAAAILGISPFATARDLYYDKLKIVPFDDSESNWVAKKMGHLLEDLVAEIFHVKTGYRIYQIKKMFYHPVHTFMLADIDYFVELPKGRTAILEIKTTNYNAKDHWWSENGQEIVPLNYEAQGRHYMAVMNIDEVFYCCLYGNNEDEVIIRHIDRDHDYEEELIALERDFWENHILTGTPPPYTEDGDLILNSVRRHFGPADPSAPELILEGNMALLIPRYLELQTQRNAEKRNYEHIEAEMRRLQGRIVAEMGRSCTAVCQGREAEYSISYKPVRKSGISKDNLQRLQAQHPDIYEQYVTVSESRRFYVKNNERRLHELAYTGVYERTIFYNPVNKYSVISVKTSDRSIPEKARSAYRHRDNMIHFAAAGYELPRTDQVSMILDGEWKEGKNGFQLHVTKCEEVVPQTREGIKGYLSSRLIKGIGGKTAELIVDRFGADTLHVLENEPERLLEIRGVSKAKLEEIIASYNESRTLRDLMLLLVPFQITPTTATKIYDHFGAHSVDILRDNLFELCQIS